MQEHHDESLDWIKDAERWICQIQGVRHCKIDVDAAGEVTGIHVISAIDREPRHVVRDVEGLLKARLDLDVYYKKIGVVQVLDSEPAVPEKVAVDEPEPVAASRASAATEHVRPYELPTPVVLPTNARPAVLVEETVAVRVECEGVGVSVTGARLTAHVDLRWGDRRVRGERSGVAGDEADQALVAQATLAAVLELVEQPLGLELVEIAVRELAGEALVLAAVDLVEGRRRQRLFGSCPRSGGAQQAAAYAVLDALNRRLDTLLAKEVD